MTRKDTLYFDVDGLSPKEEYVAWIDMMGAQAAMSQSLKASANHIGRIHAALVDAQERSPKPVGVRVYPVMDGAYITSETKKSATTVIRRVFASCSAYFAETEEPHHRFLIRGGLARGPIIHGSTITERNCAPLSKSANHKGSLLFGIPMIHAFRAEANAPPFGVYLHASVRGYVNESEEPFSGVWLNWWTGKGFGNLASGFRERLVEHFDWLGRNTHRIGYPQDRLKFHEELATQQFRLDDVRNELKQSASGKSDPKQSANDTPTDSMQGDADTARKSEEPGSEMEATKPIRRRRRRTPKRGKGTA